MTCNGTTRNGTHVETAYWNPLEYLQLDNMNAMNYAVVVLNRPIRQTPKFLIPFWNKAKLRIAVDGGTNRWFNYISKNCTYGDLMPIDIVSGDFDSIRPENLLKAKEQGAEIINTPDQNETDFMKSLRVLEQTRILNNIKLDSIFVVSQTSGRLDQIMGNINTLFLCLVKQIFSQGFSVYLLSDDSISWLLCPGEHVISVPTSLRNSRYSWCGLIPIGEKCMNITTTGLKWNLKNGIMEFGGIVSSSNTFDGSETVSVKTDSWILWCMNILPLFNYYYNVSLEED